jgi:hypothetical protein
MHTTLIADPKDLWLGVQIMQLHFMVSPQLSRVLSLSFTYFPQYPNLIQAQSVFVTVPITRP